MNTKPQKSPPPHSMDTFQEVFQKLFTFFSRMFKRIWDLLQVAYTIILRKSSRGKQWYSFSNFLPESMYWMWY